MTRTIPAARLRLPSVRETKERDDTKDEGEDDDDDDGDGDEDDQSPLVDGASENHWPLIPKGPRRSVSSSSFTSLGAVLDSIQRDWLLIAATNIDAALAVVARRWNQQHTSDDSQRRTFVAQLQQIGTDRFGTGFDLSKIWLPIRAPSSRLAPSLPTWSTSREEHQPVEDIRIKAPLSTTTASTFFRSLRDTGVSAADSRTLDATVPHDASTRSSDSQMSSVAADMVSPSEYCRIEEFQFGTVTNELVQNLATGEVRRPNAYAQIQVDPKRYRDMMQKENPHATEEEGSTMIVPTITVPQASGGINDILMGTAERGMSCVPCGKSMNACQGHYGRLNLIIPQVSPSYMEPFMKIAQCVCPHCYNLIFPVTPELEAELLNMEPSKRTKRCVELCKNVRYCGELWDRKHVPVAAHKKRVRRHKRRKLFALQFEVDQRERIEQEPDQQQQEEQSRLIETQRGEKQKKVITATTTTTTATPSTVQQKNKLLSSSRLPVSRSSLASSTSSKKKATTVLRKAVKTHGRGVSTKSNSPPSSDGSSADSSSSENDDEDVEDEEGAVEEEEEEDDGEQEKNDDENEDEDEEDEDVQAGEQDDAELGDMEKDEDIAPDEEDTTNDLERDSTVDDDDDDDGGLGDMDDDDVFDGDGMGGGGGRSRRRPKRRAPKKKKRPTGKKPLGAPKRVSAKAAKPSVGTKRGGLTTKTPVKTTRTARTSLPTTKTSSVTKTSIKTTAITSTTSTDVTKVAAIVDGKRRKKPKKTPVVDDVTLESEAQKLETANVEFNQDMNQFWKENPYDPCSRLCKPYDPETFEERGCGGPMPEYTSRNLDIHATFEMPWEGNPSKADWPAHNHWTLYEMLRYVRPRDQILMGADPVRSPIRGYMIVNMPILPPSDRPSKNEGSKNSTPDDITGFCKTITQHRNRQLLSLWEDGIARLVQHPKHNVPVLSVNLSLLPSNHRHVYWVKRPRPGTACECNARSGKRCTCDFSGERVPCKCDDPLICRCILDSLPVESIYRKTEDPSVFLHTPSSLSAVVAPSVALDDRAPVSTSVESKPVTGSVVASTNANPTNGAPPVIPGRAAAGSRMFVPGKRRASAKGWSEHSSAVGNELIVYMSGEIKKRGEGSKKSGTTTKQGVPPPAQSTWASTNAACGKIIRQQKSLYGRQLGKGGRFRGTLVGKRGNFTHRAVIGPCIELGIDEAGFPMGAKTILSFPERIERWNRADGIDAIRAGEVNYLYHTDTEEAMYGLEYLNPSTLMPPNGMIIERQLRNGAVGILNRQPTLHKPSMQGVTARFMATYCTFLNLSNTTPYNADFDGDEMTFYLSRSHQSRAETLEIMMASKQFRSQQGASIVMGMVQNASLAAYLLTRRDRFFTRQEFMHLCAQFSHEDNADLRGRFDRVVTDGLPIPSLLYPEPLWTGMQLVSTLLPEGFYYAPKGVPLQLSALERDPVIINGQMLAGRLTKGHVGPGSNTIPHVILQDYGPRTTKNWLKGNQLVWNAFLEQWPVSMSRQDYLMHDEPFRLAVLRALNETAMSPEHHQYNLSVPNDTEMFLRKIQARAHEIITEKHKQELDEHNAALRTDIGAKNSGISISDEGSVVANHVRSLTLSGTKASMNHVGQLGAAMGQQQGEQAGRMVSQTSHYNRTRHLPEAHAFVGNCFAQGLHPMSYFYHVKVGRYGMLQTTKTVPSVGYVQRRLGVILSGMHVAHDRTVRDSYGNIYQFGYGDDALDPSMLEHDKLEFVTPIAHADPELAANQKNLLTIWATLHRDSEMAPRNLVLPVQFKRLLARVRHLYTANATEKKKALSPPEVDVLRSVWFDMLRRVHKMDLINENLLLRTLLLDLLSSWHVSTHCGMSGEELAQLFTQLEHYLVQAFAPPGESVGTIAAQSLGEPAMQIGLNQFKHADSKAKKMVGAAMAAFMAGTSQASEKLNECINATKREALGVMDVAFRAPYNKSLEAASIAAERLPCKRLLQLLVSATTYKPGERLPDAFINRYIALSRNGFDHRENVSKSLDKFPITRLEFSRKDCERLDLSLFEIEWYIKVFFRRGAYVWKYGEHDRHTTPNGNYIVYVNLDIYKHPQLTKRIENFQKKRKDLGPINIVTVAESVLVRCLFTIIVRGIPQVTYAYPVEMGRYVYRPENLANPIERIEEWGAKTQGSNFEALTRVKFVNFEACTTTFVHDVNKFLGIEAARVCQEETLDSLVRGVSGLDVRHIKIIADVMTAYTRGKVIPMTRSGMAEIDNNVFRLAAFEEIIKNLVNGAVHARKDTLRSVSASNMFGNRMPSGTGTVSVVPRTDKKLQAPPDVPSKQSDSTAVSASTIATTMSPDSSHTADTGATKPDAAETATKPATETWRDTVHELCGYQQRRVPCEAAEWSFYQFFIPTRPSSIYGPLAERRETTFSTLDPADEFCATYREQLNDPSLLTSATDSIFFPQDASAPHTPLPPPPPPPSVHAPKGRPLKSNLATTVPKPHVHPATFHDVEEEDGPDRSLGDAHGRPLSSHRQKIRPGPAHFTVFRGRPLIPTSNNVTSPLATTAPRAVPLAIPYRQFGWIENTLD